MSCWCLIMYFYAQSVPVGDTNWTIHEIAVPHQNGKVLRNLEPLCGCLSVVHWRQVRGWSLHPPRVRSVVELVTRDAAFSPNLIIPSCIDLWDGFDGHMNWGVLLMDMYLCFFFFFLCDGKSWRSPSRTPISLDIIWFAWLLLQARRLPTSPNAHLNAKEFYLFTHCVYCRCVASPVWILLWAGLFLLDCVWQLIL